MKLTIVSILAFTSFGSSMAADPIPSAINPGQVLASSVSDQFRAPFVEKSSQAVDIGEHGKNASLAKAPTDVLYADDGVTKQRALQELSTNGQQRLEQELQQDLQQKLASTGQLETKMHRRRAAINDPYAQSETTTKKPYSELDFEEWKAIHDDYHHLKVAPHAVPTQVRRKLCPNPAVPHGYKLKVLSCTIPDLFGHTASTRFSFSQDMVDVDHLEIMKFRDTMKHMKGDLAQSILVGHPSSGDVKENLESAPAKATMFANANDVLDSLRTVFPTDWKVVQDGASEARVAAIDAMQKLVRKHTKYKMVHAQLNETVDVGPTAVQRKLKASPKGRVGNKHSGSVTDLEFVDTPAQPQSNIQEQEKAAEHVNDPGPSDMQTVEAEIQNERVVKKNFTPKTKRDLAPNYKEGSWSFDDQELLDEYKAKPKPQSNVQKVERVDADEPLDIQPSDVHEEDDLEPSDIQKAEMAKEATANSKKDRVIQNGESALEEANFELTTPQVHAQKPKKNRVTHTDFESGESSLIDETNLKPATGDKPQSDKTTEVAESQLLEHQVTKKTRTVADDEGELTDFEPTKSPLDTAKNETPKAKEETFAKPQSLVQKTKVKSKKGKGAKAKGFRPMPTDPFKKQKKEEATAKAEEEELNRRLQELKDKIGQSLVQASATEAELGQEEDITDDEEMKLAELEMAAKSMISSLSKLSEIVPADGQIEPVATEVVKPASALVQTASKQRDHPSSEEQTSQEIWKLFSPGVSEEIGAQGLIELSGETKKNKKRSGAIDSEIEHLHLTDPQMEALQRMREAEKEERNKVTQSKKNRAGLKSTASWAATADNSKPSSSLTQEKAKVTPNMPEGRVVREDETMESIRLSLSRPFQGRDELRRELEAPDWQHYGPHDGNKMEKTLNEMKETVDKYYPGHALYPPVQPKLVKARKKYCPNPAISVKYKTEVLSCTITDFFGTASESHKYSEALMEKDALEIEDYKRIMHANIPTVYKEMIVKGQKPPLEWISHQKGFDVPEHIYPGDGHNDERERERMNAPPLRGADRYDDTDKYSKREHLRKAFEAAAIRGLEVNPGDTTSKLARREIEQAIDHAQDDVKTLTTPEYMVMTPDGPVAPELKTDFGWESAQADNSIFAMADIWGNALADWVIQDKKNKDKWSSFRQKHPMKKADLEMVQKVQDYFDKDNGVSAKVNLNDHNLNLKEIAAQNSHDNVFASTPVQPGSPIKNMLMKAMDSEDIATLTDVIKAEIASRGGDDMDVGYAKLTAERYRKRDPFGEDLSPVVVGILIGVVLLLIVVIITFSKRVQEANDPLRYKHGLSLESSDIESSETGSTDRELKKRMERFEARLEEHTRMLEAEDGEAVTSTDDPGSRQDKSGPSSAPNWMTKR